jgi:hypothetical protein
MDITTLEEYEKWVASAYSNGEICTMDYDIHTLLILQFKDSKMLRIYEQQVLKQ